MPYRSARSVCVDQLGEGSGLIARPFCVRGRSPASADGRGKVSPPSHAARDAHKERPMGREPRLRSVELGQARRAAATWVCRLRATFEAAGLAGVQERFGEEGTGFLFENHGLSLHAAIVARERSVARTGAPCDLDPFLDSTEDFIRGARRAARVMHSRLSRPRERRPCGTPRRGSRRTASPTRAGPSSGDGPGEPEPPAGEPAGRLNGIGAA